jgi:curli biogenesis system outer membrane secretion channel CsgG
MKGYFCIAVLSLVIGLGLSLPALAVENNRKSQEQIATCIKKRAWMAYFRDDKGKLAPVRDTLNTEKDEDWLGLQFTDYEGPRLRLKVLRIFNESVYSEERENAGRIEVPVSGIQETVTAALYNTKRFDVIEHRRSKEIEDEQTRKDVVEPSPSLIFSIGKLLGAQYLVYGTVNEWTPDRGHRNMWPGNFLKKEAEVAITFTLADLATGQVLFITSERARLGEWSFGFGNSRDQDTAIKNTPVGYAVQACANKAAFKIAAFFRDRKWKGTVVDVKGPDLYINAGSQQGMAPQSKLSVQSVRGVVRNWDGTSLGEDLRGIGTLEVVFVQNAFSIARVVEGCKGIKKGDRVELATDLVPPQMIPECTALDASQSF